MNIKRWKPICNHSFAPAHLKPIRWLEGSSGGAIIADIGSMIRNHWTWGSGKLSGFKAKWTLKNVHLNFRRRTICLLNLWTNFYRVAINISQPQKLAKWPSHHCRLWPKGRLLWPGHFQRLICFQSIKTLKKWSSKRRLWSEHSWICARHWVSQFWRFSDITMSHCEAV